MTIGINVYVQLKDGAHLTPAKLAAFRQPYFPDEKKDLIKDGLWNGKGQNPSGYGLQPLREVHTGVDVDEWSAVSAKDIWLLVGIAAGHSDYCLYQFYNAGNWQVCRPCKRSRYKKSIGRPSQTIDIPGFLRNHYCLLCFLQQ